MAQRLDEHECGHQGRSRGQRHDCGRVIPTVHRGAGETVDEQHGARRHGRGAGQVETAAPTRACVQHARSHEGQHEADGHVDEQDPAPREIGGDHPSQQQAESTAAGRDRRIDPKCAVTRRPFRERAGQQGERGGGDDRRPHALRGPRDDECRRRCGEPARQRARGKDKGAGDEHPQPAVEVTHPAAQQKQSAERDRVCVDHPLQVGGVELQGVLYRRQRHIDDGDVQHDHQLRDGDHDQRDAAVARLGHFD